MGLNKISVDKPIRTSADMYIGEIAVINIDEHPNNGKHILRTYDNFVCLESPRSTWGIGTQLGIITVEEPIQFEYDPNNSEGLS